MGKITPCGYWGGGKGGGLAAESRRFLNRFTVIAGTGMVGIWGSV